LPELDAVVVITSESISTRDTMQVVWDKLLPEMKKEVLPKNQSEYRQLTQRLKSLKYDPPILTTHSPVEKMISGREFILDKNEFNAGSVVFSFSEDRCVFTLKEDGKPDIRIINGINHWIRENNYKPAPHSLFSLRRIDFDSIVAASATWQDEQTLLLTWRYIETVHGDSLRCIFEEDRITIKLLFSATNLQGKPDERPDLTGHMK
jgi:hypothetical protein